MATIPKMPVSIMFDPAGNVETKDLWAIPSGRILMLLWRPCHIVGSDWNFISVGIANRIMRTRPTTHAALMECFRPAVDGYGDYSLSDCHAFCNEAMAFFTGERSVSYCGFVVGEASMTREFESTEIK